MTVRIRRRIAMLHPEDADVALDSAARQHIFEQLATAPGVERSQVGWHHPRSVNAGVGTWDALVTHDDPPPTIDGLRLDVVHPVHIASELREPDIGPCIKRTLFLRVEPGADSASVTGLEADLAEMPHHITAIRNWCLSAVAPGASPGTEGWTHVWEQEFATLDGVLHDYLYHPHHWGHVDRWFDPEHPSRIADLRLAHAIASVDAPVLPWAVHVRR